MAVAVQAKSGVSVKWWQYPLLLAVPASAVVWLLNSSGGNSQLTIAVFVLAALALVPLATMIGDATESLASHVGPVLGGLLSATFSNVPELAIGIFLLLQAHVHSDSAAIVQSDQNIIRGLLIGSVINNVLLVLGISVFTSTFRHGRLNFSKESAGSFASMLALAVVGLALPTLANSFPHEGEGIENVSLLVGAVLILSYIAYVASSVFHWHDKPEGAARAETPRAQSDTKGFLGAFIIFGVVTIATVVIAFILVDTTDHVVQNTPLTSLSVGLILFPILCNIGEMGSTITSALHRDMEGAMSVVGSSAVQVPLLVAPLLVIAGFLFSGGSAEQMLSLVFQPLELIVVGLVTFVYALVSLDGEVTWLEGLQLIAFYAMIAVTAFAIPGR
jgi:Ca2+:H+ antiporter